MNLSLLTNKQMEMRTNKFMIYVFSAIMLGGMVACSSDDPETDTGNGNGNGGNAEAPYVWGAEGAIKTCDHLLFDDDKTENAKGRDSHYLTDKAEVDRFIRERGDQYGGILGYVYP